MNFFDQLGGVFVCIGCGLYSQEDYILNQDTELNINNKKKIKLLGDGLLFTYLFIMEYLHCLGWPQTHSPCSTE